MRTLAIAALIAAALLVTTANDAAGQDAGPHVALGYDRLMVGEVRSPIGVNLTVDGPLGWQKVYWTALFSYDRVESRLEPGPSLHSPTGYSTYAGGGIGVRHAANARFNIIGHVLLGYARVGAEDRATVRGSEVSVKVAAHAIRPRVGGGLEYRLHSGDALRFVLDYDTEPHLTAAYSFGF